MKNCKIWKENRFSSYQQLMAIVHAFIKNTGKIPLEGQILPHKLLVLIWMMGVSLIRIRKH